MYRKINMTASSNFGINHLNIFQEPRRAKFQQFQTHKLVRMFIEVFQTTNVTAYIHAMMKQVSEFMDLHGSILSFTQQGL